MNYIYDVVLNFNKEYYDFFEWNEEDNFLHLKKIPIIRISTKKLILFLTKKIKLNEDIIKSIENKTETYKFNDYNNYFCILSDNINSIACEFNKNGTLLKVSSMLLDEENEANDLSKKLPLTKLNLTIIKDNKKQNFKTREEIMKEKFVKKQIKNIFENQKYELLDYIYYEFNGIDKKNKKIKDFINDSRNLNKLYALLKIISINNSINS